MAFVSILVTCVIGITVCMRFPPEEAIGVVEALSEVTVKIVLSGVEASFVSIVVGLT